MELGVPKKVADVVSHLKSFSPSYPLKKGYIGHLICSGEQKKEIMKKVIHYYVSDYVKNVSFEIKIMSALSRLEKKLKNFSKHANGLWNAFTNFCSEDFYYIPASDSSSSVLPGPITSSVPSGLPSVLPFLESHHLSPVPEPSALPTSSASQIILPPLTCILSPPSSCSFSSVSPLSSPSPPHLVSSISCVLPPPGLSIQSPLPPSGFSFPSYLTYPDHSYACLKLATAPVSDCQSNILATPVFDHQYSSDKIDVPATNTRSSIRHSNCFKCKDRQYTIKTLRHKIQSLTQTNKELKEKIKNPEIRKLKKKLWKTQHSARLWKGRWMLEKKASKHVASLMLELEKSQNMLKEFEQSHHKVVESLRVKKKECESLTNELKMLGKLYDNTLTKLESSKKKNNSYRELVKKTEEESARQLQTFINECLIDDDDDEIDALSNKLNMYSVCIRKVIYCCLINHVAVDRVQDVVKFIVKCLSGKTISVFPCTSSISRMAYEVSVLSDIQVGHVIASSDCVTLGFDATTYEGRHVSEVNITCSPSLKTLTISLAVVPGGKTEDYHSHIISALTEIASFYSGASGLPDIDVKELFWRKIRSTISDRAKVNHCLVQRLKEEMDVDLLELKCNVHPLDGLARSAKKVLADLDTQWALGASTKCQVEILISSLAHLRFSKGKGDPPAFCSFLEERNIRRGVLARYVGNRMNILFHMAATVFNLRDVLLTFANENSKALSSQVAKSLERPLIHVQLQCLGLFSKVLTGPWMTIMYKNAKKRTNLEVVKDGLFSKCLDMLVEVEQSPEILFTTKTDLFGDALDDEDSVLQDLQVKGKLFSDYPAEFHSCIRGLATAFHTTLKVQLKDYVEGSLAEVTEEMLSAAASAPINNMGSERALSMMDALWHRAPSAALGFIESKIKAAMNSTLDWLSGLEPDVAQKYIEFAVRHGPKVQKVRRHRERLTRREVAERRKLSSEKFKQQKRKQLGASVSGSSSGSCDVRALPCLLSLDEKIRDMLEKLMSGDDSLFSGVILEHVWHESGEDVVYLEMLKSLGSSVDDDGVAMPEVVLFYCKPGECLSSACDELTLPLCQFINDFVVGDVRLKEVVTD